LREGRGLGDQAPNVRLGVEGPEVAADFSDTLRALVFVGVAYLRDEFVLFGVHESCPLKVAANGTS
jgi:hypothetical protein